MAVFLAVDTQLIMGNKELAYNSEDYVNAALQLYLVRIEKKTYYYYLNILFSNETCWLEGYLHNVLVYIATGERRIQEVRPKKDAIFRKMTILF